MEMDSRMGVVGLLMLALVGCSDSDGGRGAGGTAGTVGDGFQFYNPDAGARPDANALAERDDDGGLPDELDPCKRLESRNVDLLFMVDNSGSMQEEQESLRREFPRMLRMLTSGDRDEDGVEDFPPVEDLHVGVVSSDMGLPGIQGIPGCEGLGDDGIMNNVPDPNQTGCDAAYPRFLEYAVGDGVDGIAEDFGCVAGLGIEGCGFEQQLEAALKALWPSDDDRIDFVTDVMGEGSTGQGDRANDGFLRRNGGKDTSVVAVVVVTDEDDCSSHDLRHFTPELYLEPGDPLIDQDLNLRCFYNPQNLYKTSRYVDGLRRLREGNEDLVVFAAIAGVPPDLVDETARAGLNLTDPAARDVYYEGILSDPRMQEAPDPTSIPGQASLIPSCITDSGKAYPPRRITQVARDFGENGIIQSICQDDFGPAIDVIVDAIGRTVKNACIVE